MSNTNIILPVILSGGAGSRLWPKSRFNLPKPFINIWDDCLLSSTVNRLNSDQNPFCVTTQTLKVLTEKVFRKHSISPENIIYEPAGKNTAPAIALLCKFMELKNLKDQIVGIFPADHYVENTSNFNMCLKLASQAAAEGFVVTLGIIPNIASSEFGYIEVDQNIKAISPNSSVANVLSFKEKPNKELANKFLASQKFLWNSGMFIFKVSTMIDLFQKHQPEIWNQFAHLKSDLSNLADIYSQLPNISIDYAVIEKAQNIKCIPSEMGWSDVGTWDELIKHHEGDQNLVTEASSGCHVVSHEKKTYSFVGVSDLIVVDTKDACLIVKKGESSKVSKIVDNLKKSDSQILYTTHFEERPWGNFEVIRDESHYKSKLIIVEPGQKLSYQSHQKRAEHWIVVKGTAEVTIDDKTQILNAGQHIFIPLKAKHRLANPFQESLELVEIQVGEYFGEDDIQRYNDEYGRV